MIAVGVVLHGLRDVAHVGQGHRGVHKLRHEGGVAGADGVAVGLAGLGLHAGVFVVLLDQGIEVLAGGELGRHFIQPGLEVGKGGFQGLLALGFRFVQGGLGVGHGLIQGGAGLGQLSLGFVVHAFCLLGVVVLGHGGLGVGQGLFSVGHGGVGGVNGGLVVRGELEQNLLYIAVAGGRIVRLLAVVDRGAVSGEVLFVLLLGVVDVDLILVLDFLVRHGDVLDRVIAELVGLRGFQGVFSEAFQGAKVVLFGVLAGFFLQGVAFAGGFAEIAAVDHLLKHLVEVGFRIGLGGGSFFLRQGVQAQLLALLLENDVFDRLVMHGGQGFGVDLLGRGHGVAADAVVLVHLIIVGIIVVQIVFLIGQLFQVFALGDGFPVHIQDDLGGVLHLILDHQGTAAEGQGSDQQQQ